MPAVAPLPQPVQLERPKKPSERRKRGIAGAVDGQMPFLNGLLMATAPPYQSPEPFT